MANKIFGGEMRFTLSTGQIIETRGKVAIDPVNFEKKSGANDDGSVYATVSALPYTFDISFQDNGYDYRALMLAEMNITLSEDITGVQHLFTGAGLEGKPSIDRRTGEVTGVTGYSADYRRV